jgi:hypothetical protein
MTWQDYLKTISKEDISDWKKALKAFIKEGRNLGMPLDIIKSLEEINEE